MIDWNLREECVLRILFESGCRVSEAVGLTLGDWMARGMLQEVNAFSKGSHGARVKFLRFSNDTAKLLRRYFDEERRRYDPEERTLADYVQLAQGHEAYPWLEEKVYAKLRQRTVDLVRQSVEAQLQECTRKTL